MNLYVFVILCVLIAFILRILYVILYQYFYWKIKKLPHLKLVDVLKNTCDFQVGELSAADLVFRLYNTYKNASYYGLFDGLQPVILIRDPDLIRQVCEERFENFTDCVPTVIKDATVSHNLINLNGPEWEKMRRKLSPIYNITNKSFFRKIWICAGNFAEYLSRYQKEAKKLDVKEAFNRFISNVTIEVTFGMKEDTLNQPSEFYMHSLIARNSQPLLKIYLMNIFPRIIKFFGITFLPMATDKYYRNLIKEHIYNMIQSSIVHSMLESKNDQDDIVMTEDEIICQVINIITKNSGMSCSLMTYTCLLLAKNQEVQIKLYEELIKHFPDENKKTTYGEITEMKYLDMVLKESLRLFPPMTLTTRICVKDIRFPPPMDGYPGHHINKGTLLIIPIIALHRDLNYHQNPDDFIPERFSDENKSKMTKYTYMPFGLGPRKCLGEDFAVMETKIVICRILQKFVIRYADDTHNAEIFKCGTLLTTTQDGLKLKFQLRKKDN